MQQQTQNSIHILIQLLYVQTAAVLLCHVSWRSDCKATLSLDSSTHLRHFIYMRLWRILFSKLFLFKFKTDRHRPHTTRKIFLSKFSNFYKVLCMYEKTYDKLKHTQKWLVILCKLQLSKIFHKSFISIREHNTDSKIYFGKSGPAYHT